MQPCCCSSKRSLPVVEFKTGRAFTVSLFFSPDSIDFFTLVAAAAAAGAAAEDNEAAEERRKKPLLAET